MIKHNLATSGNFFSEFGNFFPMIIWHHWSPGLFVRCVFIYLPASKRCRVVCLCVPLNDSVERDSRLFAFKAPPRQICKTPKHTHTYNNQWRKKINTLKITTHNHPNMHTLTFALSSYVLLLLLYSLSAYTCEELLLVNFAKWSLHLHKLVRRGSGGGSEGGGDDGWSAAASKWQLNLGRAN